MTARRLSNVLIESASLAGDTSKESLARFPDHSMRSASRETGPLLDGAGAVTRDVRQQGLHVVCHVDVVVVVFLCVGRFREHARFVFVAGPAVWV